MLMSLEAASGCLPINLLIKGSSFDEKDGLLNVAATAGMCFVEFDND